MRSAKECLAMAVDIERQAGLSEAPAYRADQATDGWKKVFAFFKKHLG